MFVIWRGAKTLFQSSVSQELVARCRYELGQIRVTRLPFLPPPDFLVCSSVRHGLTLLLYGLWNKRSSLARRRVLIRAPRSYLGRGYCSAKGRETDSPALTRVADVPNLSRSARLPTKHVKPYCYGVRAKSKNNCKTDNFARRGVLTSRLACCSSTVAQWSAAFSLRGEFVWHAITAGWSSGSRIVG